MQAAIYKNTVAYHSAVVSLLGDSEAVIGGELGIIAEKPSVKEATLSRTVR
jgi:hypothetical protein